MSNIQCLYFISLFCATVFAVPNENIIVKDYRGQDFLDNKHQYFMQWLVDWDKKVVQFRLIVKTTGWVGLGFSKDGTMNNADIVIAGVSPSGRGYISDMHTDCNRNLKLDTTQNWVLINATASGDKTTLQISRPIDTCDYEDYQLTEDLVNIIWAFGETDAIEYHFNNRGSYEVYLLDIVAHSSPAADLLPKWKVARRFTLPPKVTTYWCSIYKIPPQVNRKHHIIEWRPFLENAVAVKHTHHFILWKCTVPANVDSRAIFEPLLGFPGEECYFNDNHRIPINLCRTAYYTWALGGKTFVLPDHVGFSIGEVPNEYFMLETHYDNPERTNGIVFETGVEAVYTSRLRRSDGMSIFFGYDLFGLFIIPPGTLNEQIHGHCGPECTRTMFPSSGIDIFAAQSHGHRSAKKMKLRQFRNGVEMPWIIKDDNYDFLFQQTRPLHKPRKVLPGDQVTMSCGYDDTWTNVTTVAAFGGKDEMCIGVAYFNQIIPYYSCFGQTPQDKLLRLFGLRNFTWDLTTEERTITSPNSLNGVPLAEIFDENTIWTKHLRETLQSIQISSTQTVACPSILPPNDSPANVVSMAQGYGVDTLMGPIPLPTITPGPWKSCGLPSLQTHFGRSRNCPAP